MKIKAKRTTSGDYGRIERGQVADIPQKTAEMLIKRGVAEEVAQPKAESKPKATKAKSDDA